MAVQVTANKLSEGRVTGMIDVEINGIVEPSEWDKLELAAGFSGQVWND